MTETLLSASNILLFGRRVADLKIVKPRVDYRGPGRRFEADFVIHENVALSGLPGEIGGVSAQAGDIVLAVKQSDKKKNGLYTIKSGTWERVEGTDSTEDYKRGVVVSAEFGNRERFDGSTWVLRKNGVNVGSSNIVFRRTKASRRHSPFIADRRGGNRLLEEQLLRKHRPAFARIYGFSYDGTYYDMGSSVILLVHGVGELASGISRDPQDPGFAKGPGDPSINGMSASDFQFSDELRVWSYDRADYTIRMDLESGMMDDVLIGPFFTGGMAGAKVSGAKVSGAKVSGAKVSGAKVSGAKLSGAKVSGAKLSGDASD